MGLAGTGYTKMSGPGCVTSPCSVGCGYVRGRWVVVRWDFAVGEVCGATCRARRCLVRAAQPGATAGAVVRGRSAVGSAAVAASAARRSLRSSAR